MVFFCGYCIVYGVWTFSVDGLVGFVWRTERMMSVRDWWAVIFSIIGFLVIMYDMLRFIIRDVANKGFESSLRTLMFSVCSKSVHERLESRFQFDLRAFVSCCERLSR